MIQDTLAALANAIWCTWLELSLWLLVGVVAAGVMHVCLPAHLIQRKLSGPWGPLRAVLFGIPMPLCSCGVIPAAMQLKKEGAQDGSILGFLIATPQTGVDSVFASASLLGWPFAWFKVGSALAMGLLGGYGLQWSQSKESAIPKTDLDHHCEDRHHNHHHHELRSSTWRERLAESRSFVFELVDNLAGWLVVGVLISASLDVLVPKSVFTTLAQWGSVSVTLAVLGLSLPLYVCATASVPIAASLVAQGLPMGAALVFLMAGPATNVATMGALYRSVGARALVWYLGTIIAGSVLLAYLLDEHLGWAPVLNLGHVHSPDASLLETICGIVLAVWVLRSLVKRVQAYFADRRASAAQGPKVEFWVSGLTCNGCVRGLSEKLRAVPGVTELSVDLETGAVQAFGHATQQALEENAVKAGYEIKPEPSHEHHHACGHSH